MGFGWPVAANEDNGPRCLSGDRTGNRGQEAPNGATNYWSCIIFVVLRHLRASWGLTD